MNFFKKLISVLISIVLSFSFVTSIDVYASQKGNTAGNLANGGDAVTSGGWNYYVEDYSIKKSKPDGSNSQTILDSHGSVSSVWGLNIIGDWLYYVKGNTLYKIKTNGTNKKQISKDYVDPYGTVTVYKNWIFYNSYTMNKIKTDGSGRKKLLKNNIDIADFSVSGTWLYYIDYDKGLYKIKHNGKSKKRIKKGSEMQSCQVSNGWIYYTTANGSLYRIKSNGKCNQKLHSNVAFYNVSNNWIYYTSHSKKHEGFYKMKTNGKGSKNLIPNVKAYNIYNGFIYYTYDKKIPHSKNIKPLSYIDPLSINILGDSIYFINSVDHVWYRYRMSTNGKNLKLYWTNYDDEE